MIKIWHDDIRKAPDGWLWARTNESAKNLLVKLQGQVSEISLDHDLGLEELDPDAYVMLNGEEAHVSFLAGQSEITGYDLVNWMCVMQLVPPKVTIHSWNPAGAQKMALKLNDCGYDCIIKPFEGSR